MDISLEFVLDRFGLHNPLVGSLPIFMNKLSGLVGVHGMNLILSVLNVRGLNLKALNEHFYQKKKTETSLEMLPLPLNLNPAACAGCSR